MKEVKIKIISARSFGPFHDTTEGKEYDALIIEAGEITPEPYSRPWAAGPEEFKCVAFLDDVGDDVLQNYDDYEGQTFIVI